MKIYKAIPLFITLFLGADSLKAQSTQSDSLKTYELDEIVIEENSENKEEIEKLELKKTGLTNSIYFGDPIRELRSNSFVQTFSPLVSTFFIDGLPINEFGGFYIENIAILGSPWEQEWESISLSTKLSSKLFSNLSVNNNNYSTKYDALLGLVKVDLKDIDEKNFGFEGSTTLFNRYATAN